MIISLTDTEREDILRLAETLYANKEREQRLLRNIIHEAKYNSVKKLESSVTTYASAAEANFLDGKKLAVLARTGRDVSTYDFEKMGGTEMFPCTLSFDGDVWEFYLPPTPSIKVGKVGKDAGRFTAHLVRKLIQDHELRYSKIKMLAKPVVVFEYGFSKIDTFSRLFDSDNRDNKKALDAMTGAFFSDDNALSIMTVHYGVETDEDCTKIYVMEDSFFDEWRAEKRNS